MAAKKKSLIEGLDTFLDHGIHPETATLWIGSDSDEPEGDISPSSAARVLKGLYLFSRTIPRETDVNIVLNCPGGDTDQGFAIYDAIRQLENRVIITVYGQASSMAAAILQAGDLRRMAPHSSLMIHFGEATIKGYNSKTLKNNLKLAEQEDDWYSAILLEQIQNKFPSLTRNKLNSWMESDTIFLPEKALEFGLVDEILKPAGDK